MAGILLRQPDYTCTETVERTRQAVGSAARIDDTRWGDPTERASRSALRFFEYPAQEVDPACGMANAKLWADVNRGQLLAPKGSIARGRIVRLDRYSDYFVLGIKFQDLDWTGGHARLKLSFDYAALARRLMGRQADGTTLISRQASPHLSGILMFWRSE